MKLSREEKRRLAETRKLIGSEERKEITAGGWPVLEWSTEEPCPVEPGQVLEVTSRLSIEVLRITERAGFWRARYRKSDMRAEPYLASAQPSVQDAINLDKSWSWEQEHGYSGSPRSHMADAGRAVPRHFQEKLTHEKQAEIAWSQEQARIREEKMGLEFKLARERLGGRRATVTAIEQRIVRLDGRIEDAA